MFVTKHFLLLSFASFLGAKGFNHCGLQIPCDDSQCIERQVWCDLVTDCTDGSDEKYCQTKSFWVTPDNICDVEQHFTCKNRKCIPKVLRCDGYDDCKDDSDEDDCQDIDQYRLLLRKRLFCCKNGLCIKKRSWCDGIRDCSDGSDEHHCPGNFHACDADQFKCKSGNMCIPQDGYCDGLVSCPDGSDEKNCFNRDCLRPEMFKCSEVSCVSPEKQCDGNKDCENGLDEQNCGFVAFSRVFFENSRKHAWRWLRSQHDANWGWKENTARAVVALYLSNDINLNSTSHEDDLVAKQLELEVSTFLLRNTIEKASITKMATYINALQAICHNPRNFYGFDLVQNLKQEIESTPNYSIPFPYLTLCNAKEIVSEGAIDSLLQIINRPSDFGFTLEIQALASMALSCISRKDQYTHLKQNLTEHLNKIMKRQMEDGSFGNEYTTALVIQALIGNNQVNYKDWNFKAAAKYLDRKQKPDGSFGDFLTTYLIMPAMNGKSLVDLNRVNCTESRSRPREGNPASEIKNRLGGKIPVKYSLIIGDNKDQVLPILLRTPENITVFELMTLAADIDPKYKFRTHKTKEKTYVYEISGIPNNPEENKFWFLYQQVGNDTEQSSKQGPDEVYVMENCHMSMWYRTLTM